MRRNCEICGGEINLEKFLKYSRENINRNDEIRYLCQTGKSLNSIATKFNISRQRVFQIVNRKTSSQVVTKKYCDKCKLDLRSKTTGRELTREKVRKRDDYTCQICGKKWEKGQRKFDVHHRDSKKEKTRQYDKFEKEKDNLITLCHKCHLNLPESKLAMKQGWELKRPASKKRVQNELAVV